jgi:hypothetical protein
MKYRSTTVIAPSSGGTSIAMRSTSSGRPVPGSTRNRAASNQSKVGGQIGCAPWGKFRKGSKVSDRGKFSTEYRILRRW